MNPQAQNSSRHAVRVASISLLLLGAEAFAAPPAVDSRCPSPTVGDPHGHCILPRDVVLDAPLDLASFTTLDCKGHTITPAHPDVLLPSAIVPVPSSDPQTAILVHDSVAVTIKNCVIEKFDHAIVFANDKVPAAARTDPAALARLRNRIAGNRIVSIARAVSLYEVDNTELRDNYLKSGAVNVVGIFFDSDFNVIKDNVIVGEVGSGFDSFLPGLDTTNTPQPPAVAVPGWPFRTAQLNAIIVFSTQFPGIRTNQLIRNLGITIVGGQELLIVLHEGDRAEGNVVEANDITVGPDWSPVPRNGIRNDQTVGSVIRGNTIRGATQGIMESNSQFNPQLYQYAGACIDDPARPCLESRDCKTGDCAGQTTSTMNYDNVDSVIEDNRIVGPITDNGILVSRSANATIRGNQISTARKGGVFLEAAGLTSALVTDNRIAGNVSGLFLSPVAAPGFGARVSRNDITDSAVRVSHAAGYGLASELSTEARGNNWDRAVCPGFVKADDVRQYVGPCADFGTCTNDATRRCRFVGECVLPGLCDVSGSLVKRCAASGSSCSADSDCMVASSATAIDDGHPYVVPVAGLAVDELPATCP